MYSVLKYSRKVEFDLDRWGLVYQADSFCEWRKGYITMGFALLPWGLLADEALAHLEAM